jgi:hypothetical protein
MLELIKELMAHEWQFELVHGPYGLSSDHEMDYHLHFFHWNAEFIICDDKEAEKVLDELREWWKSY